MKPKFNLPPQPKPERPETEFEKKFKLFRQYREQVKTLTETGLIELLPSGKMGFYDINGDLRELPEYEDCLDNFHKQIKQDPQFYKEKYAQGFKKLLIVPFGMSLHNIIDRAGRLMQKKYKEKKLLTRLKDDPAEYELQDLDIKEPVRIGVLYISPEIGMDFDSALEYFRKTNPWQDSEKKTKKEIIKQSESVFKEKLGAGYNFLLIKDLPYFPESGKGMPINEPKDRSYEFLKIDRNTAEYRGEEFFSLEDELTYLIYYLQNYNIIINDGENNYGSVVPGCILKKTSAGILSVKWDENQLKISDLQTMNCGARTYLMIS